MKYIAEFKRIYDWNKKEYEWRVQEIFDKKGFNVFTNGWIRVDEKSLKTIEEMNDNIKYKYIDDEDFEINGNCMDCTKANEKFETLEDVVKKTIRG